jgi:hypothetical protein
MNREPVGNGLGANSVPIPLPRPVEIFLSD